MAIPIRELIVAIFLIVGLVFITISAVGVVRLPDFYTRLHASSIGETIGILIAFAGLAIYQGPDQIALKLFVIAFVVYLFNPIGTHMLGRAALRSKLRSRMDEFEEEN